MVRNQTKYVAGLPIDMGGSGDPSPLTAYGVFCGIQAAVAFRQRRGFDPQARLDGLTVAVQGLGNVGMAVCRHLHAVGASLTVTDIDQAVVGQACHELSATSVDPQTIYDADADVFAPCALGRTLTSDTVSRLKATIVAGAANNQLATPSIARALTRRNILYAPDFVINAGGIINISYEGQDYDRQKALLRTRNIGVTLTEIFERGESDHRTTAEVAIAMARSRLGGRGPSKLVKYSNVS